MKNKLSAQEWNKVYNTHNINFINVWKKSPKKLLLIFISAILFNIGVATFLSKAAVVATGTSSLTQIITFINNWDKYFGYFYVLINLPIIFVFWKKNPRLFMVLTCYWLFFQVVSQLILGQINFIDKFLTETITLYSPNGHKYWNAFNLNETSAGYYDGQTWPIIIYCIIGGVLDGIAAAIAWRAGGCVAGSNVIVYYVSRVKKMSIGKIAFIVAMSFATFSIIVLGALEVYDLIPSRPWKATWDAQKNPLTRLIVRIICTVIYIGVYSFVIDLMYPKYKKVKLEIYSTKIEKITEHLKLIRYNHSHNIYYGISGYTHKDFGRIETITLFLEKDWVIGQIKHVDSNAWISILPIHEVVGEFDTSYID
ncbi:YitT family protein [Mycoplasma miroungirhinis]|uniref:YitT family protein n=1 Tax=Mycoplasma miroungirhinis TaxID=754516 RepID=A0A6M4JDV4_9MOLU|nr:YitT family protein [Mycoplasma miroungirhinis]QJR44418.1 YitT family protein [Mycoplasma miroungirhinis]